MKYPLFKVHVDVDDVMPRLKKVLESGFLNEGREVIEFKELLKKRLKTDKVTMTSSCTASLMMGLKIAGVKPGDEVIAPSMTCVATNVSTEWLGAKTVWADIDSRTGNIDPRDVERKITSKTKAVICVDWAGIPCDLEKLQNVCLKNNVKLIQDAAHAFGSNYKGKDICHWADITCYSFQAIKHITSGDGGAVVCRSDEDHEFASRLKWYGFDRDRLKDADGNWKGKRWDSNIQDVGWKMNMNNISAAIGISNLSRENKIVESHKKNAKIYRDFFADKKKINNLLVNEDMDPAWWIYTVVLDEKVDRDAVIEKMKSYDIHTGVVHVPNHPYDCFDDADDLPETEKFAKHQICIPCGWWLSEEEVRYIAHCLVEATEVC
jgi:perosamine synthetase